ncbi:MAG: hypothetical protein M1813_003730 [Trichoglossum hirsutum]|nr:MAG: hypothetical protein M1813_003730 [Trichoglossum hirsutum]
MEAMRFRTPSPNGHGSIGSSTAASSPTGFDAHFHSRFDYFSNNSKQPTHRGRVGGVSTKQYQQPSLHNNDRTEDFTTDLLRYINGRHEHSSDSERTKLEAEDSCSTEDGPSDFTENLGEWMAEEKAFGVPERSEKESSASPETEITVTPEAGCYHPSLTVEDGIEVDSELPNDHISILSPAAEDSDSGSNSDSPKINRYPTPMVEDGNSDCVSNSPSFNPDHIAVSSPDQFWHPWRREVVETPSNEQASDPFTGFSGAFPSAASARSSPSNFMATIFNREREMMLSQVETLTSQVRSWKLRFEQAESAFGELQSLKSELEEWKRKGDEVKEANARMDFMNWETATLKQLLAEREKITCDIATQKIEIEGMLRRKEEETLRAATEMASQKAGFEEALRHKEKENLTLTAEVASQKAEFEEAVRRKEKENATITAKVSLQKAELEEVLGCKEKENAAITAKVASQKAELEETLKRKEKENAMLATEVASQKAEFEAELRNKEKENAMITTEIASQKAEFEVAMRRKEEEITKATAEAASQKLKFEAVLQRKEEKNKKIIAEIVLQSLEYEASLRQKDEENQNMATEVTKAKEQIESLMALRAEDSAKLTARISTLNNELDDLKRESEERLDVTFFETEIDSMKRELVEDAQKARAQVAALIKEKDFAQAEIDRMIRLDIDKSRSAKVELGLEKRHNAQRLRAAMEEVDFLRNESKSLRAEVDLLKARNAEDMDDALDEITFLKTEVNSLRSKNATQDRIASGEIASLQTEVSSLKIANAEMANRQTTTLRAEVDQLSKLKEEEFKKLANELSSSKEELNELKSSEAVLKGEIDTLRAKAEDTETKNAYINTLRAEIGALKGEAGDVKSENAYIQTLRAEVGTLKAGLEGIESKDAYINTLTAEIGALGAKVGDAESENARINTLRTEVDDSFRTKAKELETAMRAIAVLNANIDLLKNENAEDSNKANARLRKLCSERDFWMSNAKEAKNITQVDSLKMELDASKKQSTEQSERLLEQIESLGADVDMWMSKAKHQEKRNSEIASLREDLKARAQENGRVATELETSKRRSKEHIGRLLAQIESLGADVDMWMSEAKQQEKQNSEIASLEEDLEARDQENGRLVTELETSKRRSKEQIECLLAQVESLGAGVDMWMSRAKRQEKQNSEMASLMEGLEAEAQENSRLAAEIETLRRALGVERDATAQVVLLKEEVQRWRSSTKIFKEKLKAEKSERARVKKENEQSSRELKKSLAESMKSRETYWKDKVDAMKKEREVMAKVLMHQWGREECGYSEPQLYRYKYVKRT